MHISENKKIFFVHNMKTGGTSIRTYLEQHISDAQYILPSHAYVTDGIEKLGRDVWDEYYSFGFVRNPWSRLVSWYSMVVNPPKDIPNNSGINRENSLWEYVKKNSSNLEEFIINCTDTVTENRDGFIYKRSLSSNQLDYFTDKDGEIAVNFIGQFENIEDDFNKIKIEAKLPDYPLPYLNATKKKDYREYYNEHTRELVAKRFSKDIEHFGYKF